MITVGILSDTHIYSPNDIFLEQCTIAFVECDIIVHAGDLIDTSILAAFKGKEIHAVCGNMCNRNTRQTLPPEKQLALGGYSIGIIHGAGSRHDIEERVLEKFPATDCIIFGHSHIPIWRKIAHTLLINPGSFRATGMHAAGTYAILYIDQNGLDGSIRTLPTHKDLYHIIS